MCIYIYIYMNKYMYMCPHPSPARVGGCRGPAPSGSAACLPGIALMIGGADARVDRSLCVRVYTVCIVCVRTSCVPTRNPPTPTPTPTPTSTSTSTPTPTRGGRGGGIPTPTQTLHPPTPTIHKQQRCKSAAIQQQQCSNAAGDRHTTFHRGGEGAAVWHIYKIKSMER